MNQHPCETDKCYNPSRIYWLLILAILLFSVSLYDLFSPPITPTCARQTWTAMLTENFVKEGFSLKGLYLNVFGNEKKMVVQEFPIYNFITGLFYYYINNNIFWGKLVSLLGSIITLLYLFKLINKYYGERLAIFSCLFFIFSPLGLLMRTSVQPDALGLMFQIIALNYLFSWKENGFTKNLVFFSLALLMAGLSKYPIIVPYLPIMAATFLFPSKGFRVPRVREVVIIFLLFLIPLIAWYLYRGKITHPDLRPDYMVFLIGDLRRFLSIEYYIKPLYVIGGMIFCGVGIVFFLLGLVRVRLCEIIFLSGIPLYFIIIPTVSDQYYYMYAVLPLFAFFMARGYLIVLNYFAINKQSTLIYVITILYAFGFIISTAYVLRHDKVMLAASEAVKKISLPGDLIISMTLHDRDHVGFNPVILYLAQRKGWFVEVASEGDNSIEAQIEAAKSRGARWLVITYYSADQEPWFESLIPKNLRRSPGIDGKKMLLHLQAHYKIVNESRNYAILDLSKGN